MSIDREIQDLRNQVEKDPEDDEAKLNLINARTRVEGAQVLVEPLKDRLLWNRSSDSIQDIAIEEVNRQLVDFSLVDIQRYECGGQAHRIASFQHNRFGILFNLIPGGNLTGENWEFYVSPFLMGKTLLLQKEWDLFGGEDSRQVFDPDLPINKCDWYSFLDGLKKQNSGFRLPSEAEWEFAYRSGTKTLFYWGEAADLDYCWCDDNSDEVQLPSLHEDKANAFGLIDMSGNLWELCADKWCDSFDPLKESPVVLDHSKRFVIRGGSFIEWVSRACVLSRSYVAPSTIRNWNSGIGIRLAHSCFS